jgi:hypothetical protein
MTKIREKPTAENLNQTKLNVEKLNLENIITSIQLLEAMIKQKIKNRLKKFNNTVIIVIPKQTRRMLKKQLEN